MSTSKEIKKRIFFKKDEKDKKNKKAGVGLIKTSRGRRFLYWGVGIYLFISMFFIGGVAAYFYFMDNRTDLNSLIDQQHEYDLIETPSTADVYQMVNTYNHLNFSAQTNDLKITVLPEDKSVSIFPSDEKKYRSFAVIHYSILEIIHIDELIDRNLGSFLGDPDAPDVRMQIETLNPAPDCGWPLIWDNVNVDIFAEQRLVTVITVDGSDLCVGSMLGYYVYK